MVTRMPPPWHSRTASIASLRGGSSRPITPSRTRFLRRAARLQAGILEPGERQHALALAGELIGGAHKVCPIDRLRLTAGGLLSVAMLEDDFGRALHEEEFLAVRGFVQRRHELVLRLERD